MAECGKPPLAAATEACGEDDIGCEARPKANETLATLGLRRRARLIVARAPGAASASKAVRCVRADAQSARAWAYTRAAELNASTAQSNPDNSLIALSVTDKLGSVNGGPIENL